MPTFAGKLDAGQPISEDTLRAAGLVHSKLAGVRLLAKGETTLPEESEDAADPCQGPFDPSSESGSEPGIWTGGTAEDYLPLHQWFDEPSKLITADFRHRALRHLAEAGAIGADDLTVAYITGNGLKTQEVVEDTVQPLLVTPTFASFQQALKERGGLAKVAAK